MKPRAPQTRPDLSLDFTPEVTRDHGEIFAKIFLFSACRTEAPGEAFRLSGVMPWPDDPEDDSPAAMRHERIEDEILRRVFDEIETPLRDAFIRYARYVIERERRNQKLRHGANVFVRPSGTAA